MEAKVHQLDSNEGKGKDEKGKKEEEMRTGEGATETR